MKLLLDSQALIWWFVADHRLSKRAQELITTEECFVSPASAFEIAFKARLGKLDIARELATNFSKICQQQRFKPIDLTVEHAILAASFDSEHRDPFDRLLAAQALAEELIVLTRDAAFQGFGCMAIW